MYKTQCFYKRRKRLKNNFVCDDAFDDGAGATSSSGDDTTCRLRTSSFKKEFLFSSRTRGKYLNRMKCQISINSVQHPNHNNCSHMHAFFPLEGNYCVCRRCKWCFLLEPLSFGPLRDVLQRPLFGSIPVVEERPGALFVLLDHCLQWPIRAACAL